MKKILRWIFFIPAAFLLAIFVTYPLHWFFILYFDKEALFYNYREEIESSIESFFIGYVFVYSSAYIAPKYQKQLARIIMMFLSISIFAILLLAIIYDISLQKTSYVGMPLIVVGSIIAFLVVSGKAKEDLELKNYQTRIDENDD